MSVQVEMLTPEQLERARAIFGELGRQLGESFARVTPLIQELARQLALAVPGLMAAQRLAEEVERAWRERRAWRMRIDYRRKYLAHGWRARR